MTNLAFKLSERNLKNNLKLIRGNGHVPGVVYGEFLEKSIPVQIPSNDLNKLLKYNSKGSIIPLELNNSTKNYVVKDIQKNINGELIHVDFQYVKNNEVIKMTIPIKYSGQDMLEIKRLVLETHLPSLEFQGPVELIPEYIHVDVSKMNFNDKLTASDIEIPKGITLLTDSNATLAIVN